MARESLGEPLFDRGTQSPLVSFDFGDGIIDQLGDVRVFLEAVANAVVVELEARLPQIAEDGGCRDVVQIGSHANVE